MGRRVWGAGFGAPGLGRRVWGAGFGAPGLGRRVWGGAACPCGARCAPPPPGGERVGFAVLSPPRTILSQALVSHGEEGNCSLRPLPCPLGKGRCQCAGSTLFALRAKALQSGAPHFGVSRKKQGFGAFYPSGNIPGAPGGGERASPRKERSFSRTPSPLRSHNEPLPTRNGYTPHLTVKTRPSSHKTLHIYPSMANAAHYKLRLIAPAFRGEHQAHAQAQRSTPAKGHLSAFPATASSPKPSRRENGGLCPHPLKGPNP